MSVVFAVVFVLALEFIWQLLAPTEDIERAGKICVGDIVSVFYEESSIEKYSTEAGSIIGGFVGGIIAGTVTEGSATEKGVIAGAALGAVFGDKISSGVISIINFFIDISNFRLQDIPDDTVQDYNNVNGG
ncbi:MAG: hypothetical protein H0Z18_07765 [Thermococcus sp.]|uniref:hypothetical protein n=1 Tax=Thermococcus sp. TaxID=35749 RepID=UPI001DDABE58|nr:hypothetical protein [Thermococcus sp.]MBO8175138.1 hypothetical protein [Thermococcus sp.]